MQIGVQGYGLGSKWDQDFEGTIHAVRDVGISAIEPVVLLAEQQGRRHLHLWSMETLQRGVREIEHCGMVIPSVHVWAGKDDFYQGRVLPVVERVHKEYGIQNFVFSGSFIRAKEAESWAGLLRTLSEKLPQANIVYHNHDTVFRNTTVNGEKVSALEHFFRSAGERVYLQLDIGWASFHGDELEIARHYGDRILELHCKDFTAEAFAGHYGRDEIPDNCFCAIGEGIVRHKEVLAMSGTFPHFNGAVIIDQDKSGGDILEDLQTGYQNLTRMIRSVDSPREGC